MSKQEEQVTDEAEKAKPAAAGKAAATDQESEAGENEAETSLDDGDMADLTPKQKAYVERLRKENAKTRVKAKELEGKYTSLNERFGKLEGGLKKLFGEEDDDSLPPEKKIEKLSQQNEALALSMALKEAALEHGVSKADYEYFEFLVQKKMQGLKEGDEMSEEDVAAIAKQARAKSAPRATSVGADGDEERTPAEEDGDVSLAEFQQMGIVARSVLYQKDRNLYDKLAAQDRLAKKKK